MLETLNQSQATTNSKCHCLPNDRRVTVVKAAVVWATWNTRDHHYWQATVTKYSLIYHLLIWNAHEINILMEARNRMVWDSSVWNFVWLQWRNKPQLLLSTLCCYGFENLYSASLPVIKPINSGFQILF